MTETVVLTPAAYLREVAVEAQRLSGEERDELILGMSAHVAELEKQGLEPSEMSQALVALGNPRQVVDEFLAVAGSLVKPYKVKAVCAAVAFAWLAVLSGFALHPWFLSSFGINGVVIGVAIASWLNFLAGLVVLVTTIVGGMWRRWKDGLSAFALVVVGPSMPALTLAALTSDGASNGSDCRARFGDLCLSGPSSTSSVVLRALLAVAVLAVVLSTLHWAGRLLRQSAVALTTRNRRRFSIALVAFAVVGLAVVASPVHFVPTGKVRIENDLGSTVTITYCPRQDCSGQAPQQLRDGDELEFGMRSGRIPDSVVVTDRDGAHRCGTLPLDMEMSDPDGWITGEARISLSENLDTESCGADVDSMGLR